MRKVCVLLLLALLALFAFSPLHVYAEEIDSTDSASPVGDTIREKVGDRLTRISEIRDLARERFQDKKKTLEARAAKIRDEKKTEILMRLVAKIESVNEKWINHWSAILERLSAILTKMDARAELIAIDSDAYTEASTLAKAKIDDANTLLQEAADNIYVPEITTDAALGEAVTEVTSEFRENVKAVHTAVGSAREAVHAAFQVLKEQGGTSE